MEKAQSRCGAMACVAVAGLAIRTGAKARKARQRDAEQPFLEGDGPAGSSVDVGVAGIELPIRYWRTDCFMGLFPAGYGAVRELLPSSRLYPVRLPGGRALVAVVAYNYLETGVGPYGEIGISPLCTLDRAAPPLVPLVQGYRHGFGGFVAHLPVTSRVAREAGRRVWGYPKFVADMDFDLRPEHQQVTLAEGDSEILRLDVRRSGHVALERTPLTTFTVRDGRLVRTTVATRAHVATALGSSGGALALGDHPVGRALAGLGLSATPVVTRTYLTHSAILPAGEDIGPSDRAYVGYEGADRESGRHTVRYDGRAVRVVTESRPSLIATPAGSG